MSHSDSRGPPSSQPSAFKTSKSRFSQLVSPLRHWFLKMEHRERLLALIDLFHFPFPSLTLITESLPRLYSGSSSLLRYQTFSLNAEFSVAIILYFFFNWINEWMNKIWLDFLIRMLIIISTCMALLFSRVLTLFTAFGNEGQVLYPFDRFRLRRIYLQRSEGWAMSRAIEINRWWKGRISPVNRYICYP